VQERGFNGFSYADIASELGVTKAALHYHFASKADLGDALIERYAERFFAALASVDADDADAVDKLRAYAKLYTDVFRDDRMCLCGMLAADYATLPDPMRERVVKFFDDNEVWLTRVLEEGRESGTIRFEGSARPVARTLIGSLEGAMLVARPYHDVKRFRDAADLLIRGLAVER
jgi:TetR/AcrR family transcriptional repressor of nem operon